MARYAIVIIPGDGIGLEIMEATLKVLRRLDVDMEFVRCELSYETLKREGTKAIDEALGLIKQCDSCLKGPTMTLPGPGTYKSIAVTLRQELDLYANVRPFKSRKGVRALHEDIDFIIVRENTECLYKGLEYRIGDSALGLRIITTRCCERIARFAFELAMKEGRKKVTIAHKANILKETCGLFRDICIRIAKDFPDITFEDMFVDAVALKMIRSPQDFDIILTTNMFGDILSDEAAGIIGSPGLAPSANIGDKYSIFETAHGTAPDIAGKGIANPCSLLFSSAMMLKHLGEKEVANRLEKAIERVLGEGKYLTPDLGGKASTNQMVEAIINSL